MKKIKHVYYTYQIIDNFGHKHEYENKSEATRMKKYYAEERKILDFVKPKGVTLVLSKDTEYYAECIPAFLGWNGVPFCDSNRDKNRDFYMNLSNSIERSSSIYGSMVDVIKRAYNLMDVCGRKSFDRHDGAYHFSFDVVYGNEHAMFHPNAYARGVFWYNWDGETFTTNDKKCKLTSEDFK